MKNNALWTRVFIVLSLLSIIGQIPGLLYLSGPEPYPAYTHRFDHVMYGISQMLSFLVAPVCAISAFIAGLRRLRLARQKNPPAQGTNIPRRILLASGTGVVLACLVVTLYVESGYTIYEYRDADPRVTIEIRLDNIAAAAYQYRIRPRSMQGGEGSYKGFALRRLETDTGWWGTVYTYKILSVSADSIRFEGRCGGEITGAVCATLDSDGHWTNRRYYGEFDY